MNHTCPFCATVVAPINDNKHFCSFCNIELHSDSIFGSARKNGERPQPKTSSDYIKIDSTNVREYTDRPMQELLQLHTLDLLLLLKAIRSERSSSYDLLKSFNLMLDEGQEVYRDVADEAGIEYEYWTRKAWTIENILIVRMGYYPQRITENMINSVCEQSSIIENKNMRISTKKKCV